MRHKKRSRNRRSKNEIIKWFSDLSMVGWLIFLNVVISLAGFFVFALGGVEYIALKPENILRGRYLWTLITHMFIHGGPFHLFVNMFVLFSIGGLSERIIGRKRFLRFYLISGIFAGLLSAVLAGLYGNSDLGSRIFGDPDIFMVGASGAIFAIAGLFVVLLPHLRFMIIFLPFFSLPAYIMVPLVLFVTWIVTIAGDFPIGNVAHFGGFIAGLGYGFYLRSKYKKKVQMLQKMVR